MNFKGNEKYSLRAKKKASTTFSGRAYQQMASNPENTAS